MTMVRRCSMITTLSQHILEHLDIQRLIGDDALQTAILPAPAAVGLATYDRTSNLGYRQLVCLSMALAHR